VRKEAFESLLDTTQPAETAPRPERAERPERPGSTERRSETRRTDDDRPRAEPRRAHDNTDRTAAPADRHQTKPTASSTRQAKDGQAPSPAEDSAAEAKPEEAATQEFLALAEGAVVVSEGEAETAKTDETKPADAEETDTADGTDETTGEVKADTKSADATTMVATVLPVVVQAETTPTPADTEGDIAPAAVDADAPATPADDAAPDLAPDAAPQKAAAPDAPKQADAKPAQSTPTEDGEKPAEVLAATPTEKPQPKADTPADTKAEKTETAKAGVHTAPHHAAKPVAHEEAARAQTTDGTETKDAKAPAAPQHAKAAEHAPAAHTAQAEARNDNAPAFATQTAATNTINSVTAVPLHISAPSALPTLSSLTALRVDTPADKGVPIAGLAVEIVAKANEGSKRFEIRLDPPELGRIDVRLDVDQTGKVTSRLVVERTETLDLLRRDAHQLERALSNAGLDTGGGLEFSLRDQSFAGRDQQQREGGNRSNLIIPEDESIATEAARRGYGRMIGLGGGVDIRI
jgi:flagellar hook-length control protein FliK